MPKVAAMQNVSQESAYACVSACGIVLVLFMHAMSAGAHAELG